MEAEDSMRRIPHIVGIAMFALVGCSSKGSSRPDAQDDVGSVQPEAGAELPAAQADSANPNQGSDAIAQPDQASPPETAGKKDAAAAPDTSPASDVARLDVRFNPPDATVDATARKDLAAIADTAPGADLSSAEAGLVSAGTVLGGCQILPTNHIFNTPIDSLSVHASSAATADMPWDPLPESDCVDQSSGSTYPVVPPCLASKAPKPWLPIPAAPLVEGSIVTDPTQPYGDHHMLIIDADTCRLWELYHCYPNTAGGWDIFGSSTFDLRSNALRPAEWPSADAAGFPILPLLLLASEASSGEIRHALRFTISSSSIRNQYVWPARHLTTNGSMSASLPPMGQLFRIKASYQIPASYGTQSRAILQALKTYGMYIADGGSNMYIQGDPSASWQDSTFSQVQTVGSSQFEAVDLSPIMNRAGFDPNSAAVPAP